MEEKTEQATTSIVGVKSSGKTTISAKPAQRIKDITAKSYTHQSTGIGELDRVLGGGLVPGASIIVAGPPGVGKALALDTPVATPAGWTLMGELKVGDTVFGDDGNPTTIVAVSETWQNRPCYLVNFTDGTSIVADANHEWLTEYMPLAAAVPADSVKIRTTLEIFSGINANLPGGYYEPEFSILLAKPLNIETNESPVVTNEEWKLFLAEEASEESFLNFSKFLRAPKVKRRHALSVILDKKGQVGHGSKYISSFFNKKEYAEFLIELVNTLGYQGIYRYSVINGKSGREIVHQADFSTTDSCFGVFKWNTVDDLPLNEVPVRRFIKSVVPSVSVPVVCIEVNNESHMFLAGKSMIPTHNSSILSHVASIMSMKEKVLYISGEESVNQIKLRAERTNTVGDNFFLASENDLSKAMWHIDEIKPDLIIVDSMQTIASPDIDGRAGSPSQVTEVATMFTRICKERGVPLIMVGHFTKDGNVAGPRTVEHLVDVVLSFEGEDDSPLRFLRAIKNRFGAADEIGCFEHTEEGLAEVPDPSGLLLGDRVNAIAGVCSSIFLEGKRPLPVEIQALVAPTFLPNPRRVTSGLDSARTLMIQAVVDKRGGVKIADKDIYVSTIAGTRIKEPAVDLATVIAIVSSAKDKNIDPKVVALGEVTLSGEIRKVPGMNRRLQEAIRLGFNFAFVPPGTIAGLPPSFSRSDIVLVERSNVFGMVQAIDAMSDSK
jgi:DNA repair protein RadA